MLCEVIAYILSRQRLSAKTFVAGYFFMLCRIDCLCGCCATPPVSEASLSTSPRVHPSGITRGYAWCVPAGNSGCGLGGFSFLSLSLSTLHGFILRASPAVTHSVFPPGTVGVGWEVSLFSPSPLSTLHGFSLRASPAVKHGVSLAGDSGCGSHHKKSE